MPQTNISQTIPILCYLAAGIFGALGQYLYKIGAANLGTIAIYKNWHIFAGMTMFVLVMILFIAGFRLGGRLAVVYPVLCDNLYLGAGLGLAC